MFCVIALSVREAGGRGDHEKAPSVSGGAWWQRASLLDQRARPPGNPPLRMLVVLATTRMSMKGMSHTSRAARAVSRRAVGARPRGAEPWLPSRRPAQRGDGGNPAADDQDDPGGADAGTQREIGCQDERWVDAEAEPEIGDLAAGGGERGEEAERGGRPDRNAPPLAVSTRDQAMTHHPGEETRHYRRLVDFELRLHEVGQRGEDTDGVDGLMES